MPQLPTGTIVLWFGAIGAIPAGFVLCDGNNGTPDLRGRFLIGAGGAFPVDFTGGTSTHTHDFTGDGHTHTFAGAGDIQAGANFSATSNPSSATGETDSQSHFPPYHALAYIMRV